MSENNTTPSADETHKKKMQKRKELQDKQVLEASNTKNLLMVYTGTGKGKSTAGFGTIIRALGHGYKVGVVQFIKGAWQTGEQTALEKFNDLYLLEKGIPQGRQGEVYDTVHEPKDDVGETLNQASMVRYEVMGEGFTWETQDKNRDIAKAREAWAVALEMLADESYHLVLLDELNIVLRYDYLPLSEVLSALEKRKNHVIVTGRNAKPELIEIADLVTEMKLIKHPFREQGIKAQAGIEF